jgi:hypothetical protein
MGKQQRKYADPEAEYTDMTLRIRDAMKHTQETVEKRHDYMLQARKQRNEAEHIQWELEAGGYPAHTWLLDNEIKGIEYSTRWDPVKDWRLIETERFRYRDPEYNTRAAADNDRQAEECVPQIINCANVVRLHRESRARLGLYGDPMPPAPFEAILWPLIIWRAIRTVRRLNSGKDRRRIYLDTSNLQPLLEELRNQ